GRQTDKTKLSNDDTAPRVPKGFKTEFRQKGLASLSAKTRIEGWRKRGEGSTTDQELLISTLRKAGQILGEYYLEPGPRDAVSNGRDDRRQKVREAAQFATAPVKVE